MGHWQGSRFASAQFLGLSHLTNIWNELQWHGVMLPDNPTELRKIGITKVKDMLNTCEQERGMNDNPRESLDEWNRRSFTAYTGSNKFDNGNNF